MIDLKSENANAQGYLALPPNGKGPGILLMHAWWGLNDFFKSLADRLAAEGFVVLAPDLYGGKTTSDIAEAERLVGELESNQGYRQVIKKEEAALDYLLSHPAVEGKKIGTIGFSMGAAYASWLSTLRPEIAAVVLFYGGFFGGDEPGGAERSHAAFLGHFAENDEWEPVEGIKQGEAELKAARREVTYHFYPGVGHWFMEDNRPGVYNAEAAQIAWDRTVKFLHDKLS